MLVAILFILTSDFPISADLGSQYRPVVEFTNNRFFAFWQDLRFYPSDRSIFAARIDQSGFVIDTNGVNLMRDRAVSVDAAFDGTNFLIVVQDSC